MQALKLWDLNPSPNKTELKSLDFFNDNRIGTVLSCREIFFIIIFLSKSISKIHLGKYL